MLGLENPEEVLMILDRYRTLKQKNIPKELDEYLGYVAKTGDPVYSWPMIQYLFREKLTSVIREFHDTTPSIEELPPCPNVDAFNYENLKTALVERLDLFHAAPFTVQRLCELLTNPKKHYCRLDKFMRALEKNILVVSTIEPGRKKPESENEDTHSLDVSLESDIAGPATLSTPPVDAGSKGESEPTKDDVVAGQSIKSDADDSIVDDGDVEVKDSLEMVPAEDVEPKEIKVAGESVSNSDEKLVDDIQIDVVDDVRDKQAIVAGEIPTEVTTPVDNGEVKPDTKDESVANVVDTSAVVEKVTVGKVEPTISEPELLAVVESSVPDIEIESTSPMPIEIVPSILAEDTTTSTPTAGTESSDIISSTVGVDAVIATEADPETSEPEITEVAAEEEEECKPSSPKMARLEKEVDAVGTTSASVENVCVPEVVVGGSDEIELPMVEELIEPTPSAVEEPTSTETSNSIDDVIVDGSVPEIFESDVSTTIHADSTEPKIETEINISNSELDTLPEAEPVIQSSTESIENAIEADPVPMSSEPTILIEIPEVMAVEEDTDTVAPAADTTAIKPTIGNLSQLTDASAMEATPIIPSDEQMDVDEANSADSMDL